MTMTLTRSAALKMALLITAFFCGMGAKTAIAEADRSLPLQAIFEAYLSKPHSYSYMTTGMLSGVAVSGSGNRIQTALSTSSFENHTSLVVTEFRQGSIAVAGLTKSTGSELKTHYNLSRQRIGYTQRDDGARDVGNYGVVQSAPVGFPAVARVGESGSLWTIGLYADARKRTQSATQTATWSLKAGADRSTAILEISEASASAIGPVAITTTTRYLIDQHNTLTLAEERTEFRGPDGSVGQMTQTFTRQ